MSTIESYTGKTSADVRAKATSWSEQMKAAWEDAGKPPLEGVPLDEAREAIGLARAVTLPDGKVWTARNGVNFWREGPIASLIQHWEKGTEGAPGLISRALSGELENTKRIQDTFKKNGLPQEWAQFRFDFDPEELQRLAGTSDREMMAEAARELARTIQNSLHTGLLGGRHMVVSAPVHLDTATPHVDFYVHQFEIKDGREIVNNVEFRKYSPMKDTLLHIRKDLRERHGFDFDKLKINNRFVDLPWDMPKSKEERLSIEATDALENDIPDGMTELVQDASELAVEPVKTPSQMPPTQFKRPIQTPELSLVQLHRKATARTVDQKRKELAEAEAEEAAAIHAESALIEKAELEATLEAIGTERDQLNENLKEKLEELEKVTAERSKLLSDLDVTSEELHSSRQRLGELSTNFDKALEIQAKTAAKLAEAELDVTGLEADLKAAQDDYKDEKKLREETENLNAALKSDLEKRTAEIAKIADDAAKKLDETVKGFATERSAMQAQIDALKAQLEASTANAKMLEDNFAQFKENAANAAQNALREPAGDSGMSVLSTSVKARQKPNFAESVLVKSGWFSTTLKTPTATLIGNNHGIKSDSTIDDLTASTMIEYAKSKGWQHIKPTGSDLEISLLVKHAAEAGITVEGWTKPAPKASVVPADVKSEPVSAPVAEAPKTDTRKWYEKTGSAHLLDAEDKKAAEKAFENFRKAGGDKVDAITFEQFVRGANNDWKAKQNPENDDPNNDGPQRPQGKVTVKKPKR